MSSRDKNTLTDAVKKKQQRTRTTVPGPKPEILKLDGNWKDAIKESLKKRRPPQGWPKSR